MKIEDIKRISVYFKIKEQDIKEALNPSDIDKRADSSILKEKYLSSKTKKIQMVQLEAWLQSIDNFDGFDEVFVYVNDEDEEELVIKHWLTHCKNAEHAKKVFHCSPKKEMLLKEILRLWIDLSVNLEDVREANQYTKSGDEENKIAIKKIIKLF
jgi:hypothetical protein